MPRMLSLGNTCSVRKLQTPFSALCWRCFSQSSKQRQSQPAENAVGHPATGRTPQT